jgi:hypothetical protein
LLCLGSALQRTASHCLAFAMSYNASLFLALPLLLTALQGFAVA